MKTRFTNLIGLLTLLGSLVSLHAQSFTMDWLTLDGGGGASTAGRFSVSGTIGQPDARPVLYGGAYRLTGGFWSGASGAGAGPRPVLAIRQGVPSNGTNTVILSWPNPSPGYVLEERTSLSAGSQWTPVLQPATVAGANKEVLLPATGRTVYFRLVLTIR